MTVEDRSDLGVAGYDREPSAFDSPRVASLAIQFEAARPAITKARGQVVQEARPARVRIFGALGGAIDTSDPERLRYEARRLNAAADILAAEQAATPD